MVSRKNHFQIPLSKVVDRQLRLARDNVELDIKVAECLRLFSLAIASAIVVFAAVFRHQLGGRNYLRCAVRTIAEIHSGESKVRATLSWFIEPVQQDDKGVG